MSIYSNLKGGSGGSTGSAATVYSTIGELPLSDVTTGAQAYISGSDRLYIWNGTGWYNIALINTAPTITTAGNSSYALAGDGTPTVVTLEANDPEGIPITWSYAVTTGSLGSTATVSQADNVFTITPSTLESDVGDFTLTFTASDGVNLATSASEFSLKFESAFWSDVHVLLAARTSPTPVVYDKKSNATIGELGSFTASTDQTKYESVSIKATGVGASYPSISLTGDFTIELWFYHTQVSSGTYMFLWGGTGPAAFNFGDAGFGYRLGFGMVNASATGSYRISATKGSTRNAWHHYAFVRSNGQIRVYLDGVRQNMAYHTGASYTYEYFDWTGTVTPPSKIGTSGFTTYTEDFQVTQAAKYTADFTPPTQSLSSLYQGEI